MIFSGRDHGQGMFQNRRNCVSYLILVLALLFATRLGAQTVATYSFEDGTADGWTSFNGASTPVATTAAAYSGSYSLLTTTSSSGSGGPSISLNGVLLPGAQYTITGYVELTAGETATNANFTIKRTILVARAAPAMTRLAPTRFPSRLRGGCRSADRTQSAPRKLG